MLRQLMLHQIIDTPFFLVKYGPKSQKVCFRHQFPISISHIRSQHLYKAIGSVKNPY